ncbi:MAG: hypothetical protein WBR21_15345 [Rouxiella badensis]|uniref:hypothetical protein n=1 Tax=Rouxiella badensis TaxID=1646377 RepID=UPI003C371761
MPTLEQRQAALRLRNGKYPDVLAEGKVRLSMWLLLETDPDADLDRLARRFDRSRVWMEKWVAAKCPLFPYF